MAEPFKNLIDDQLIAAMARHLQRAWSEFPRSAFVRRARRGLEELELKQRVVHVADVLAHCLPDRFDAACAVLEGSLAPERDDDDLKKLVVADDGLAGWAVWPMADFVARYGIDAPERSLDALHALTKRHTAEYAIRPLLVAHRDVVMKRLRKWVRDPNPHVRRLVSEGTRPRLPWGIRLQHLVADPSPCLPLLERLQDDPSGYVRRSVANHLNDIAKDHPDVVASWVERHLPGAGEARAAMLRHASRTLVKAGDKRILTAFGVGGALRGSATFELSPRKVAIGDAVELRVELSSRARSSQQLVVDYVVHHVHKNGGTAAKVWKGFKLRLDPGESRSLRKVHSLKPVTTRRHHPGRHRVELVVNGSVVAESAFTLTAGPQHRSVSPSE